MRAQAFTSARDGSLVLGATEESRQDALAGRQGKEQGGVWYLREVLVDVFCWLLEEAFKLISRPLQTEQRNYLGAMADPVGVQRHCRKTIGE